MIISISGAVLWSESFCMYHISLNIRWYPYTGFSLQEYVYENVFNFLFDYEAAPPLPHPISWVMKWGKSYVIWVYTVFILVCLHGTCTVHANFTSQSIPFIKVIIYLSVFTCYFISDQNIIISIEAEYMYLIFCFRSVDAWADSL